MKPSQRVALLYALGFAGAGGWAYYSRSRKPDVSSDPVKVFILGGVVTGTALNVGAWLLLQGENEEALLNPLPNPLSLLQGHKKKKEGMGAMPKEAVALLSQINPSLLEDFKANGVKVASVPSNPNAVHQDAT